MIPFAWPELISDCNAARRWEPPVLILSVGPAGKQACQVTDAPPAAGRLKLRVKLMKARLHALRARRRETDGAVTDRHAVEIDLAAVDRDRVVVDEPPGRLRLRVAERIAEQRDWLADQRDRRCTGLPDLSIPPVIGATADRCRWRGRNTRTKYAPLPPK